MLVCVWQLSVLRETKQARRQQRKTTAANFDTFADYVGDWILVVVVVVVVGGDCAKQTL